MKLPYILVSSLLTTALATPSPTNTETQASSLCSQWATATTGSYLIYNNLWGEGSASSGKQCTTVDSLTSNKLAWHTSWSWAGGSSSVKSFANAAYQFSGKKLADVDSIKTSWDWSYTGTNIVADVAYDMFLKTTADASSSQYEVMVWLAAMGGAGPISASGSAIATVELAGESWSLYSGMNGEMKVFSFVAPSQDPEILSKGSYDPEEDVQSYAAFGSMTMLEQWFISKLLQGGDVSFILVDKQGVDSGLFLTDVQAGTEPFTGDGAELDVTGFEVVVS